MQVRFKYYSFPLDYFTTREIWCQGEFHKKRKRPLLPNAGSKRPPDKQRAKFQNDWKQRNDFTFRNVFRLGVLLPGGGAALRQDLPGSQQGSFSHRRPHQLVNQDREKNDAPHHRSVGQGLGGDGHP